MKKIYTYCFKIWWRPILIWFIGCMVIILSRNIGNTIFAFFALLLFVLGLVATFISSIFLFIKKHWFKAFLSFGIFGGTILIILVFVSIALSWNKRLPPDRFAEDLIIPTNIKIDKPNNLEIKNGDISRKQVERDFQLYNWFQPGLYTYEFWINKIETGTIYLKAFEITEGYSLSTKNLKVASALKIHNPTKSLRKFRLNSAFTIYEGDWGQPYAARFEVWFKPEKGGKERKLFTKNYVIEGWMR